MLRYAAIRLLGAIPTLWVIVTLAFFLMRIAPGGPFDDDRPLTPEIAANINRAYDLDKSLAEQYLIYVGRLLKGDFGPSYKVIDFTVGDLILAGLPASAFLGISAILIATIAGIALGTVAALRQNSATDVGVMAVAMTGIAIPNFVMAPLLTLLFGVYLGWLPVAGWRSNWHVVLPIVALALPKIAYVARLTRGSMVEVLRSNYVRTARAKGLSERVVVLRHALRAGLLPVVSYLGPAIAAVMTGSVVIETIFGIPGIGRYFVQGALNRDYTLVMGVVITYAAIIIAMNLIVDLVYGLLDPKVRP